MVEITYLCAETTFSVKNGVARTKDSAKIRFFVNFYAFYDVDCIFWIVLLLLNHVELSVPLYVSWYSHI